MDPVNHYTTRVSELLAHLGRRASAIGDAGSALTPVQWSALRYFGRANRFSRTPSAFASFRATTRGTASATISGLVQSGYLERHRSGADRRSVQLAPTIAGERLLEQDPMQAMERAIEALDEADRRSLAAAQGGGRRWASLRHVPRLPPPRARRFEPHLPILLRARGGRAGERRARRPLRALRARRKRLGSGPWLSTVPPDTVWQENGEWVVDPEYVAPSLGLSAEGFRRELRAGRLTGTVERGEGEDAGRTRLTFHYGDRAWAVRIDPEGSIELITPRVPRRRDGRGQPR